MQADVLTQSEFILQSIWWLSQMTTKILLRAPGETSQKQKLNTAKQILNMPPVGGEQTIQNPRKPPDILSAWDTFPWPFRAIQSLYCIHHEKPNSAPKILNVLMD